MWFLDCLGIEIKSTLEDLGTAEDGSGFDSFKD